MLAALLVPGQKYANRYGELQFFCNHSAKPQDGMRMRGNNLYSAAGRARTPSLNSASLAATTRFTELTTSGRIL